MTVGSRVLHSVSSLEEAGVNANSVVRVRAGILGGMQPAGGDFGQWTCTNPQCRANKCWPTRSRCFRCGASRGLCGEPPRLNCQDPGLPPHRPPQAREQNQLARGPPVSTSLQRCPEKRYRQPARMPLRLQQVFLLLSQSPTCRRWKN